MKQIVVLSGKGGTGKTVVTSALASLAENKVMADCDVDAANLYLLLRPETIKREDFYAGRIAEIDREKCVRCGRCIDACRFDAISGDFVIDPVACEGCGLCHRICPAGAVKLKENLCGELFVSQTRFGTMVHARLGVAEENSGKLVTLVRERASEAALAGKLDYIIIDGPPGIACPAIASITGADLALIVTEPTISGRHDLERVLDLAGHFGVRAAVCVNKFDINLENCAEIEKLCSRRNIDVVGRLPYEKAVLDSVVNCQTVVERSPGSAFSKETGKIWNTLKKML